MPIDTTPFLVDPGRRVRLKDWRTRVSPFYKSKDEYQKLLEAQVKQTSMLQEVLYADNRYAMLFIFQAMDAAGKDGMIQHVMTGVNPLGCQVSSFKQPSQTELDHDFLWRTTACLPERGRIGIFNRSYYEEVLVVRVHPEYLAAQRLPESRHGHFWRQRYRSIVDFERHMSENGTQIVKFFLHISKEEPAQALPRPDRRPRQELEIRQDRRRGTPLLERLHACLREVSECHQQGRCAVVRDPCRRQTQCPPHRVAGDQRDHVGAAFELAKSQ